MYLYLILLNLNFLQSISLIETNLFLLQTCCTFLPTLKCSSHQINNQMNQLFLNFNSMELEMKYQNQLTGFKVIIQLTFCLIIFSVVFILQIFSLPK